MMRLEAVGLPYAYVTGIFGVVQVSDSIRESRMLLRDAFLSKVFAIIPTLLNRRLILRKFAKRCSSWQV